MSQNNLFQLPPRKATPKGESVEFYTPKFILSWLAESGIAFDPCWSPDSSVKAALTLDQRNGDDGLTADWAELTRDLPYGLIFVNPPYNKCSKWVEKCYLESQRCNRPIVALVPAYAGDAYWHRAVWKRACYVGFLRGRIKFDVAPNVSAESSASFCSALVIWDDCLQGANQLVGQIAELSRHNRHAPYFLDAGKGGWLP